MLKGLFKRRGMPFSALVLLLTAAAASAFAKYAVFKDDKGANARVYVPGRKDDAKIVFVSNVSPAKFSILSIRRYFASKF